VVDVHPVHELRLTGQVDVVGALVRARRDQRAAVLEVGTDRRRDDLGRRRHVQQARLVGGVDHDQVEVSGARAEPLADLLELLLAPAGDRPPQALRRVRCEVVGGETAREPGGAEEDEVVGAGAG
jgi:hypothetical protein